MSEAFDEDEMKEIECQKDAEERLVANRRGLGSNPATVKEGLDYIRNLLHPGRFQPGVGFLPPNVTGSQESYCSHWRPPPMGNFDMSCAGLGGFCDCKRMDGVGQPVI